MLARGASAPQRPRVPDQSERGPDQFSATAGLTQHENATKLRGEDIAHAVRAALEMDDRGFIPELTVFATNPKD